MSAYDPKRTSAIHRSLERCTAWRDLDFEIAVVDQPVAEHGTPASGAVDWPNAGVIANQIDVNAMEPRRGVSLTLCFSSIRGSCWRQRPAVATFRRLA
jgi:hypothetical protein